MAKITDVVYDNALPQPDFAKQAVSQMTRYGQGGLPAPADQRGAADLSGVQQFLGDPLARREVYRSATRNYEAGGRKYTSGALLPSLAEFTEEMFNPAFAQRQRTIDPETGQPLSDPFIPPILPGAGVAGALSRKGKAIEKAAKGALGKRVVQRSAEQVAAEAGEVTAKQADVATDLAGQVETRGFARTAEDLIAARTPPPVPPQDGVRFGKDAAYELGLRSDKVAEAAGDDVAEILVRDAMNDIDPNLGIAAAKQRRGVISVETTINDLSYQTGLTVETIADTAAGKGFNSEEIVQLARSMTGAAQRVKELRESIAAVPGGAAHASTELLMRLTAASAEMARMRQVFSGGRAEAGRTLNILRHMNKVLSDPTQSTYDEALEAIGGRKNAEQLVKHLDEIWNSAADDAEKIRKTTQFVANLGQHGFATKMAEQFKNSILSHPITHEINAATSTALALVDPGVKLLAAGVEAVVTLGGKTRKREVYATQAFAEAFGLLSGLRWAPKAALDAWNETRPVIQQGQRAITLGATKFEMPSSRRALEGGVGGALNTPVRVMAAADSANKAIALKGGLYEEAARIASKEGATVPNGSWFRRVAELMSSPTDEMVERGLKQGKYFTLQSDAGKVTGALLALRKEFPVLEFVIPFITTPTNIFKRGLEFSPLGYLKAPFYKTAEERAVAVARATIGSFVLASFAGKLVEGEMTGAAPRDPAARDKFFREGKRPYAIKIGTNWVEFRRFEPISTPLIWMASAYDAWKAGELKGEKWDVLAQRATWAMVRSMADATYFRGLSEAIDALTDPNGSEERFFTSLVTAFIAPAGLYRGLAMATDKWERDPQDTWQEVMAMIPGLREDVPLRLDAYGRSQERPVSRQGLGALFNPLVVSPERKDRVDIVLDSIHRPIGLDAQGNPLPAQPFQIGFTGDEVARMRLDPTEAYRLQELAGNRTYQYLDELYAGKRTYDGKQFAQLSESDRRRASEKARDDAREWARRQLSGELMETANTPQLVSRAALIALSTIRPMRERAEYVYTLQKQGKLGDEVRRTLDLQRGSDEPTVSEYVRAAPLIDQYLRIRPYRIGNPAEWARLQETRSAMNEYIKQNPKPAGVPEWQWYYRHDPQGANLIRRYSFESAVNPQRSAFRKRNPQIERYISDTTYTWRS